MNGFVEVKKIYKDGTEEVVCRDNNILTDGLGYSIISLFTDSGSSNIEDHLVGYFQAGVGRLDPSAQPESKQKYISTLKTPLTIEGYGDSTDSEVDSHNLYKLHKGPFTQSLDDEVDTTTFVTLPDAYSTKIIDGVVHYRLNLGEETANNLNISEFGIFTRNPEGDISDETSVLIAYKNLPVGEEISKTKDFALVIDWQIKFVNEDRNSEIAPASGSQYNVVFIMLDDVGIDYLSLYDDVNPYDLSGQLNANSNPYSQIENPTNGSGIYPHTPCLSALAYGGMRFMNARAQPTCSPTRSCVITGKYNFSCKRKNQGDPASPGYWGPGIGSVPTPVAKRARGGLLGLNRSYSLLPVADAENPGANQVVPFEELIRGGDGIENTIAKQKVFAEYMKDRGYFTSFFGKWHLAKWEQETVYCEDGTPTVMGESWNHISEVGKWDYYVANWANLRNDTPIPGRTFGPPVGASWDAWQDGKRGWPNFDATQFYALGDEMGYVNYFLDVNGTILTVSDTGYVPPSLSSSSTAVTYAQGSNHSFATTQIFDKATDHFNSSGSNPEPFFMYITPNAPHDPWTYPHYDGVYNTWYKENHPQILMQTTYAAGGGTPGGRMAAVNAVSASWVTVNSQIEHFDYTLSAFIDSLDPEVKDRTIFIITSDNGSVLTDVRKRSDWAIQGVQSNGLGTTFSSMTDLGTYASSFVSPSAVRRGGENDSANQFKGSLYETGMKVPLIAYGPSAGVISGTTNAFVDMTDILSTVVDAGQGTGWDIPSDSVSFFNVLTGDTNASSHPRQYSFGESFFPIGNSTGNSANAGSNTGEALTCTDNQQVNVGQGDPTVPVRIRRSLSTRHLPEDYTVRPKPIIADLVFENFGFTGTVAGVGLDADPSPIADASGGVWKIIRPGSSGGANTGEVTNVGKGRLYDELYHLQLRDFTNVDAYELHDNILEEWKGREPGAGDPGPYILSALIGKAIDAVGLTGTLDNSVHYWNLARIYEVLRDELSYFIQYRRDPSTSVLTVDGDTSIVDEGDI
tara:strand:+ start:6019 stop:9093 length:3075 start_codon:yes stop_codon:yes gene_type:complete